MLGGQYIPAYAVDRPQLLHHLDVALVRPLTLLVAQAGSGKSVLLSQWVESHPEVCATWVDVVEADDDPTVFGAHLVDALARSNPACGDLGSIVLGAGTPFGREFVSALIPKLSATIETVIILEDLHHLTDQAMLTSLGDVVELLPPNIHLLISSRSDSPVAWSRVRLRYEVPELRQAAFAMSFDESAELVAAITGRELDRANLATLLDRTEGWVAGIQMAAMTLRLRQDPARFIAEFGGSDRLVADYLTGEVLDALPAPDRETLLGLCALDHFNAELISELDLGQSGPDLLARLEHRSMFLVPLRESREWFRFHQLFRDLLRYRMRSEVPAAEARILVRAAAWHRAHGDDERAIEYLLRAHEWDRAVDVILANAVAAIEAGDVGTVLRWLNALPAQVLADRVDVQLLRGILTGMSGDAALAEDRLRAVVAGPDSTLFETACAQTFLAALVHWGHRPHAAMEWGEQALSSIALLGDAATPDHLPDASAMTTIAMLSLGRAHFLAGDFPRARRWLTAALETDGAGHSVWRVAVLGSLALLDAWCGRTQDAVDVAGEALAIARETNNWRHAATAEAHLALALVAIERAQFDRAAIEYREGVVRAEANGRHQLSWVAFAVICEVRDLSEGGRAPGPPIGPTPPVVADRLLARQSRALRLNGAPDSARRLHGDAGATTTSAAFEEAAAELTVGHPEVAREYLRRLTDLPDADEPLGRVRALILESWCAAAVGRDERADGLLSEAMDVAEQDGLVTVFLQAGAVVIRRMGMLADGALHSTSSAVLAIAADQLEDSDRFEQAGDFTNRELDLIALLPTRLTNNELAARFVVSVNTIKTHMAHIYRKLGVANRRDAIARATQLGLIDRTAVMVEGAR